MQHKTLESDKGSDTLHVSTQERVDVDASDLISPGLSTAPTLVHSGPRPPPASSLARTLPSESQGAAAPSEHGAQSLADFETRYGMRRRLGEGGMGEVRLYRDHSIGRDVALKLIRDQMQERASAKGRFLREARVQGQLEHPSIVPVYDLGVDPNGALYFTMKRIRGNSLDGVLGGLAQRDPEMEKRFSRRKLLQSFVTVCQAIHFAHTRGVLHRDLKPANIMLGDFGEVYVLDWGLAKIKDAPELDDDEGVSVDSTPESATVQGEIMGTPGYMSPEQMRGDIANLDERADVYSLGAMLFEILTYSKLHQAQTLAGITQATLLGVLDRPSQRAPEHGIPPELDEICTTACARRREDRFANSRELYEALERFLDGDRDLELRREMSETHAHKAREAFQRSAEAASDEHAERGVAMREVTTALGLNPQNTIALRTLVSLLTKPPRIVPREAEEMFRASEHEKLRRALGWATIGYVGFALYIPFPLWMGVRSYPAWLALGLCITACAVVSYLLYKHPPRDNHVPWLHLIPATGAVMASSVMLGPFILLPTLAFVNTLAYITVTSQRSRLRVAAAGILSILIPAALAWSGLIPSFYQYSDNSMLVMPTMMNFPKLPTQSFLLISNVTLLLSSVLFMSKVRDNMIEAERAIHLQSWQLRQIVPETARNLVN